MVYFVNFLSLIAGIYMFVIFFRIILTWFPGIENGGIQAFLARITDPYLNWFRRFSFLKLGFLDLSPIAALGALSLLTHVLRILADYGKITIGIILALLLQVLWGALSFIIGFLIIVLILRLIVYLSQQKNYNPFWSGQFWHIIETISQPLLFRINRFLFRGRITNFMPVIVVSIAGLGIIYFVLRVLVSFVSVSLVRLPF